MHPLCSAGIAFTLSVLWVTFFQTWLPLNQVLRFDHLGRQAYVDFLANPHSNSFTIHLMHISYQ